MGRQRKPKISLHGITAGKLVDLTGQYCNLPSGGIVAHAIAHDPSDGGRVIALRQIRDDPLGHLHCRGGIDDVLLRAGRVWQRCYEIAHQSALRCILAGSGVLQTGSGSDSSVSDKRLHSARWIKRAAAALGEERNLIVHDILGSGRSIRWVAEARGVSRDKVRSMIQEALEILAKLAGLSMTKAA
jgi:hypothetical protein